MKNLLLSLVLFSLALPAFSQKTKKPATWQDSLMHTWSVDSFVILSSFPGLDKMPKRERSYMRLYPGGITMTYEDKEGENVQLGRFDVVEGRDRYILLGSISFMKIEKMENGRLQLLSQHDFIHSRLYLSRSDFEFPDLAKSLVGQYNQRESTGFGVMEQLAMFMNEYEPEENASQIRLDSNGKMTCFFGEADSGTWKLNNDFILELNGKVQRRYALHEMQRNKLVLHPLGMPEDSLLFFWKAEEMYPDGSDLRPAEEPPVDWEKYNDSMRMADSILAVVEYMEAEMAMSMEPTFPQTWQSIPSGDIQLVFMADHTLLFKEGKKKHKGTWIGSLYFDSWGDQFVHISFDGREQMAVYSVSTEMTNEDSELKSLSITLVPPGSKKLTTYTLYLVTEEGK